MEDYERKKIFNLLTDEEITVESLRRKEIQAKINGTHKEPELKPIYWEHGYSGAEGAAADIIRKIENTIEEGIDEVINIAVGEALVECFDEEEISVYLEKDGMLNITPNPAYRYPDEAEAQISLKNIVDKFVSFQEECYEDDDESTEIIKSIISCFDECTEKLKNLINKGE